MAKFENACNKLDAMSDTELLEFEDTYVKAKVTSYEDGALYIPTTYDEGWTILIDGVEAPLYEHHSHILMTGITEGEHIVEMKYCPVGFMPGAVITGVSVVILIAWAVIATKRCKKEQAACGQRHPESVLQPPLFPIPLREQRGGHWRSFQKSRPSASGRTKRRKAMR